MNLFIEEAKNADDRPLTLPSCSVLFLPQSAKNTSFAPLDRQIRLARSPSPRRHGAACARGRSTTEAIDFLGILRAEAGSVHIETFASSCARVHWVPGEADENINITATVKNRISRVGGEATLRFCVCGVRSGVIWAMANAHAIS